LFKAAFAVSTEGNPKQKGDNGKSAFLRIESPPQDGVLPSSNHYIATAEICPWLEAQLHGIDQTLAQCFDLVSK